MKKVILLSFAMSLLFFNLQAQTSYKIGTFNGSSFTLTKTFAQIDSAFKIKLADSLGQGFQLISAAIDDDNTSNSNDLAHFVIVAESEATETQAGTKITLGMPLRKEVSQQYEGGVDYYVGDEELVEQRMVEDDENAWKCTATAACGGCVKFKQNGRVVGCTCTNTGQGNCAFETSSSPAQNWPAWLTALVALLTLIKTW